MPTVTNLSAILCNTEDQLPLQKMTEEPFQTMSSMDPINNTVIIETFPDFNNPLILLEAFFLGLMIILTISGNLLVIVAVVPSPTLRSPTHSLIVNLAVADLLLGITVLPLSATRELYAGAWLLGPSLCSIWTSLDVLCCTASILSLCGISVDRYIGVSRPLAYSRILTKRRARILIAVIWTLALAISIAPPLGWKEEVSDTQESDNECQVNKELGYVIFSACGSFYIPALVIIVLYFLVYRAAIRHSMFLSSGSRVTRSDVTLRVHMGSTRISAASRTSLCEPVVTHHKVIILKEMDIPSVTLWNKIVDEGNELQLSTGSVGGLLLSSNSCSDSRSSVGTAASSSEGNCTIAGEQGRRLTAAGAYGRAAKFRRQKKAAKTLGIVVGGFLLCWFPFFFILPIDAACATCDLSVPFNLAFWLGYFNSCINPFIYACSSRELRRAFRGILCCRRREPRRRSLSVASLRQPSPNCSHAPPTITISMRRPTR